MASVCSFITNVLTYFCANPWTFLGIPKEKVRTFDDWCADLWINTCENPNHARWPTGVENHLIDFSRSAHRGASESSKPSPPPANQTQSRFRAGG